MTAGQKLRALREQLGLTIRDVENASARLAAKYDNDDYNVALSRLSDIETKGLVPSIFRLYALAVIYRRDIQELLGLYGINLAQSLADQVVIDPPKTHITRASLSSGDIQLPVRLDPGFDIRRTTNIGRMVERWGTVPLVFVQQLAGTEFTYGYIGTDDFTMYPLVLPGSFVQIDESRNKIVEGAWRSEYERPMYFVETRDGYTCCWCALRNGQLLLQPHPLSPVQPRMVKDQQEAEVLGQVVAIAMRLGQWTPSVTKPAKAPRQLD